MGQIPKPVPQNMTFCPWHVVPTGPHVSRGVQMEETVATSDTEQANLARASAGTDSRRRSRWLRWIPLALAMLWLVASVIVGIGLMKDEPAKVSAPSVPTPALSATSEHSLYGGDAYTGIQNAASDTEHSLVE